ncbi:unnamed protein product, partial [Brenthis ino]
MVRCSVKGCKSDSGTKIPDLSFHSFPENDNLRRNWIVATGRTDWTPKLSSKICSTHFDKEMLFKKKKLTLLLPNAVPFPDKMSEVEKYGETSAAEDSPIIECRACLQIMNADSSFFNIFDGWMPPWEGMENTIAEDLAKLAKIQILESDKHSHMICENCCQVLLTACNFTEIVRKNDKILRERYGEDLKDFNSDNDRIWPKPIQVDKSLPFENPIDIEIKQEVVSDDECPVANGSYEPHREDEPNLDIVKIEPEEMIQQQPLQIQVSVNGILPNQLSPEQMDDYDVHLTNGNSDSGDGYTEGTVKSEPVSEEDDFDPVLSDLPLECMLCAKTFNMVTGLKAHVIAQHSYKSVKRKSSTSSSLSPERKKHFATSTDLMVHETCHNKSVCYGCNENFDTFVQLTKHRRTCKVIASKEVTKLKTLDDVLRPQSKEPAQELKCTSCNETFTDVYYMNIHQEIHHNTEESVSDSTPLKVYQRKKS